MFGVLGIQAFKSMDKWNELTIELIPLYNFVNLLMTKFVKFYHFDQF